MGDPGKLFEKSSKPTAVDIVLKVPRVEMVRKFENLQPQLQAIVLFGNQPLREITRRDVERFQSSLRGKETTRRASRKGQR
jgi:hypothetical protein